MLGIVLAPPCILGLLALWKRGGILPLETADQDDVRWPAVLDKFEKYLLTLDDDAAELMSEEGGETTLATVGGVAFPVTISVESEQGGTVFVLGAFDGERDEPFETRRYRWMRGNGVERIA
ncbi:MAG: hypothetical protein QM783_12840 [Phycisphaerales bacterium]